MEEDILEIFQQYPWALESTLESILGQSDDRAKYLIEQINEIRNKWGLEAIEYNIIVANDNLGEYFQETLAKTSGMIKDTVTNMERDSDPISATAELMTLAGKATGKGAKGLGKLGKKLPVIGEYAESTGGILGNIVEFGAGFAAAMSMLVKEQEKATRLFIDYGLQTSDLMKMTDMRGALADVGMSMAELQPILQTNGAMFAKVGGDSMKGAKSFVDMAKDYEAGVGDTGDFGYNVQELTARLAEEAKLLYGVNQVDTLNANQQKRIKEQFEKSSAMTTFMAEVTGEQRSSLLKMREEANTNIDFRQAIIMNSDYITNQLGEQAINNITESRETISMLFQTFAPGIAEAVNQTVNDGIRDIGLNQTVLDNIAPDLAETVALLGADAQNSFYKMLNDSIQGKMTGQETIMAFQKFADELLQSETLKGTANSPMIDAVNNLKAQITTMPDSFKNLTAEQLKKGIADAKAKTEAADDPIDAMDAVRKGFRNAMHTITPGFETTAAAVDGFTDAVNFVGKIFDFIGIGYENPAEAIKEANEDRMDEVKDYDDDIAGIKERIADLKERIANPSWWEDVDRMKSTVLAYESRLREKQEERDHLKNTVINKKDRSYKDIIRDFRKQKEVSATKSMQMDKDEYEKNIEDMIENGAFVKLFGVKYRTEEQIRTSGLKASLRRKLARRLKLRQKKIERLKAKRERDKPKTTDTTVTPSDTSDTTVKPQVKPEETDVSSRILEKYALPSDKAELISAIMKYSKEHNIDPALAMAIAEKESNFKTDAIGDKHLKNKAYGAFQVRKPALTDINQTYGTNFSEQDMLDPTKAAQAGVMYMALQRDRYGAQNNTEIARMFNGGPTGNRKTSTIGYGADVTKKMANYASINNIAPTNSSQNNLNTLTAQHNDLQDQIQALENKKSGTFSGMFFGDDDQKELDALLKQEQALLAQINKDLQSTNIKETADG